VYRPYTPEYEARFRHKDPDGRRWTDGSLSAKSLTGGGYTYTYKGIEGFWRCPMTTMQRLDAEGRLHFTRAGGIRVKRYLEEMKGLPAQALWDDILPINSQARERLGYPTQKPLALLERILQASSREDDFVLDPFCGCGTTVHAAEKLGRRWAGIDITHLAVGLIGKRLEDAFPGVRYTVHGTPRDLTGARALAAQDKYQFQWWALSLLPRAMPFGGKKKGADGGRDGIIYFRSGARTTEKIIISVKGGENVGVAMIRELAHVVEAEGAAMGLFLTLAPPTGPMETAALAAGRYDGGDVGTFPRIQIFTIGDLLEGREPHLPATQLSPFRMAEREDRVAQDTLL